MYLHVIVEFMLFYYFFADNYIENAYNLNAHRRSSYFNLDKNKILNLIL